MSCLLWAGADSLGEGSERSSKQGTHPEERGLPVSARSKFASRSCFLPILSFGRKHERANRYTQGSVTSTISKPQRMGPLINPQVLNARLNRAPSFPGLLIPLGQWHPDRTSGRFLHDVQSRSHGKGFKAATFYPDAPFTARLVPQNLGI